MSSDSEDIFDDAEDEIWSEDDDEGAVGMADVSFNEMDDINKRAGHIAVPYRDGAVVWAGYSEVPPYLMGHEYYLPNEIWRYYYTEDTWKKFQTTGKTPNRCSGAGACVIEDSLLVVAGFQQVFSDQNEEGEEDVYLNEYEPRIEISNSLWSLCLHKLKWEMLSPGGVPPLCCDKTTMWPYNGKAYVFGGFGPPPEAVHGSVKHLFQFVEDGSGGHYSRGWSNQLLFYDREKNSWSWPICHGSPPTPRACPSSVVIRDKAYIFGGRHNEERLNDLHCLDLLTHTWSNILVPTDSPPVGRSWQSLTPLHTGKEAGGLLLYGGFDNNQKALGDCWKLDLELEAPSWTRLEHLEQGPRLWHAAVAMNPAVTIVTGGLINNILADAHITKLHAPKVLFLQVGPKSLLMSALDHICKHKETYKQQISDLPLNLKSILEARAYGG